MKTNGNATENDRDALLRTQLNDAVRGGQAHLDMSAVFDEVPDDAWGKRVEAAPHTLWQLMEHIRITLDDLLAFSTDAHYKERDWPKDYWPESDEPANADAAKESLTALKKSVDAMTALIKDPKTDLYAKISWGDGQTILREALLAATHTSYHLGQAMFLRKML